VSTPGKVTASPATQSCPRRILITLMGSLGDVTRGLAVATALKRHDAQVRITWLVEPKCEGLVRLSRQLDRVVVFERGKGLAAVRRVRRELRAESYDAALDMQRHFKSGLLTYLSGAKRRIGFARKNAKEGNWLFSTERIDSYEESSTNKFEAYERFLDALGVPRLSSPGSSGQAPLEFPDAGISGRPLSALVAEVRQSLPRYVVLVLGSSWESKNWMGQGYQGVASELLKQGVGVVLLGDKSQSALAEQLAQAFSNTEPPGAEVRKAGTPQVVNVLGKTSLEDLVSLLEHAEAAVGPDSGPGHIAAAVGTPYIGIFGATSPERTAPVGNYQRALRSPIGCSPCYLRRCPGLGRLCMRLVTVEQVLSQLKPILAR
jgi:lipopolysaccharide heptosyltransferase II